MTYAEAQVLAATARAALPDDWDATVCEEDGAPFIRVVAPWRVYHAHTPERLGALIGGARTEVRRAG